MRAVEYISDKRVPRAQKGFGVAVKALSIVSGILAALCAIGMLGNLVSGVFNASDFIIIAVFAVACWFAAKKAKDPERLEKIKAKKVDKAAVKAEKKERKAAKAEALEQKKIEIRETKDIERAKRETEKATQKAQRSAEAEEWLRKCEEAREANRLERERKNMERIRDNTPVAAVVVTAQDKTRTSSGLGSAVVGGMIAGPVGAIVGASAGKKTEITGQKVTFSVKYQSGRTGIETVDVNSKRFKQLSALLVK